MSATGTEPPESAAAAPDGQPQSCPVCGAGLRPGQDWCLNCGTAASTRIAPSPGWRAPVAIVAGVLALAVAALAVAFLTLTDDADRIARAPEPTATAAPTETPVPTPVPTETPAPTPDDTADPAGEVGTWPEGEEAWTVIVLSTSDEAGARAKAEELAAAGTSVGVLNSSDYGSLRPGFWVVFSGQYETAEEAQAAAGSLGAAAPGAYARFVQP